MYFGSLDTTEFKIYTFNTQKEKTVYIFHQSGLLDQQHSCINCKNNTQAAENQALHEIHIQPAIIPTVG